MDIKRKIAHTMITTAIDKGIRDIKENSNRGIRNLVDLGMHFSKGRFQKDFFRIAQQMLNNPKSPYYDLVNHIVNHTDPSILKHFGFNLGYNSWTYGAEKIREYEKKNGYNIPWTIVFDFTEETENSLSENEVSNILYSGESLGIYCGMFFTGKNKEHLKSLLCMLQSHNEGCFFVFLQPELMTNEIAAMIQKAGGIVPVLAVNPREGNALCEKAAQTLLYNNCLYGTYSVYNDENVEYLISSSNLKQLESLHPVFVFFVKQVLNDERKKQCFSCFMEAEKHTRKYGFFLIDFYEDLAYVDKIISVEDCFMAIRGDGSIIFSKEKPSDERLNIRTHSLEAILRQTMPKTQYT